VWELLSRLADEAAQEDVLEGLDRERAAYVELYEEAEAIAQSSIWASAKDGVVPGQRVARAARLASRIVPSQYKRKLPLRWRRKIIRVLDRSPAGR
jgi:hypothetical protein